jgi:hypothetical protein
MNGEDVASWQRCLTRFGYALADDGDFGRLTEKATIRFQAERGLTPDGIVGPQTRAAIGSAPPRKPNGEQWPFVQAKNWRWANRKTVRLIIVHTIESPEGIDTAENCAAWFAGHRGDPPMASAHACVDANSLVRCVRPEHIAFAAPGANKDGYQIEHAGRARQSAAEWADEYSENMLRISAAHAARIALAYAVPTIKLDAAAILAGDAGFCGHRDVNRAYGKSSHWDPGEHFPWDHYLDLVREAQS